jgi:DNA-binding NarL/FixJ family response regulator
MTEGRRRIRILLVDANQPFRAALAWLLARRGDVEPVAQASEGKAGVRLAEELRPDVILMELRLPDLDGVAAARAILERDESARILALTARGGDAVTAAVEAGFCGYLPKESPVDDVVAAIRAAVRGAPWLSPGAAQEVLEHLGREHLGNVQAPSALDELSSREIEVLQILADGRENDEVAAELSISPQVAEDHVSTILSKLGVSQPADATISVAGGEVSTEEGSPSGTGDGLRSTAAAS